MVMRGQRRFLSVILILLGLSQAGCVALNIPSHRFHDPTDRGGLLGDWRQAESAAMFHGEVGVETVPHLSHPTDAQVIDDGLLDQQPFGCESAPKQPDVPWPRFHPVPTRPVFAAPAEIPASM